MARKQQKEISEHVDLVHGVLYGCLKQIREASKSNNDSEPGLISVWCCEIHPSQTQKLASIIRDYVTPKDEISLSHLKRFLKSDAEVPILKTVFCSALFLSSEADVRDFISEYSTIELLKVYLIEVPRYAPSTKEISQQWSARYWPISWKGNPNHQFLNNVDFDIKRGKEIVRTLFDELQSNDYDSRSVSIFTKQNGEILCKTSYNGSNDPYDHSIMKGIEEISLLEKKSRNRNDGEDSNYLCQNLTVYCSHEPCVMCSMALVHSRIGRIIYLKESLGSGGLESNYQLGDRDGLNWTFEIWKWIEPTDVSNLDAIVSHGHQMTNY
ncbi:tRNA-specific adenosine-34 deaminase subunit [Scheffersomyces xylosifermentans]|uniref:tRNA-specific adenosine-34 deaminase subunit n=1 Tax=Scheffersomyces xylosifermentans TaxID=1304137 RepID=UPI00315C6575